MIAASTQAAMWQDEPIAVKRGDIWQLGRHRLGCLDSTSIADVGRLFDGSRFSLCFTSPPYSDQRTYKLEPFNWHSLMCGAFDRVIEHGTPDCHILINLGLSHKNRQVDMYWLEWLMYCSQTGWPVFGWYVWDKGWGMPGEQGGRLAASHEFIFHFNKQRKYPNKWIAGIPRHRETDNVGWRKPNGTIKPLDSKDKTYQPYKIPDSVIRIHKETVRGIHTASHPAVFPVALPEFIMHTWSQPDDIAYEPFCGSGTSIIAGENLKRKVYAIDIEPSYVELAIKRWQAHTGQVARLVEEVAQ